MENENGSFSFEARDRSPAQVSFIIYLNSPGGSLQPKGGGDIGDRSVKRMRDGTNTEDSYLTPSESGESWAKPGEKAGFFDFEPGGKTMPRLCYFGVFAYSND